VLHTYKKDPTEDSLAWAIYFWIGSTSSADEYGTAAYKAQELDHILDDAAVQHRVAQGNEPSEFLSLFPDGSIEVYSVYCISPPRSIRVISMISI
jgi:gelsolin